MTQAPSLSSSRTGVVQKQDISLFIKGCLFKLLHLKYYVCIWVDARHININRLSRLLQDTEFALLQASPEITDNNYKICNSFG